MTAIRHDDFKVLNQAFDAAINRWLRRQDRMTFGVHIHRPGRDIFESLLDNLQAFEHLTHADQVASKAVAALRAHDLEIEVVVSQIGLVLAKITHNTAGACDRPGATEVDRVRLRQHANAFDTVNENAISSQQPIHFRMRLAKLLAEVADHLNPRIIHVEHHTADAGIAAMKALPRSHLDDVVNLLTLREEVEERRKRPEIECRRAHIQQVILNPHDLGQDRPQVLAPRRQFDVEQLLNRMMPSNLIGQRREIIHAVNDGDILVEVEMLAELLKPRVQVADMRNSVDDLLAIERQDKPQRRMCGRMLRTKVERPQILLIGRLRIASHHVRNFKRHIFPIDSRLVSLSFSIDASSC